MQFGVKAENFVAPASSGSGNYIKYMGKDGTKEIVFLEEMGEWTVYYEHFSQTKKRSYPCTGDRESCMGCLSADERESRASRRYLVNCLDPETTYVDLWKIPQSVMADLQRYEDKDGGTILRRIYELVRYKDGDRTKYSLDRGDRHDLDIKSFSDKLHDHQEALQAAWDEAWSDSDHDDVEEKKTRKADDDEKPKARVKKKTSFTPEEAEEEYVKKESRKAKKDEEDEEKPPFDEEEDEEIELDEDELRSSELDELHELMEGLGIPVPKYDTVDETVDYLMARAGA